WRAPPPSVSARLATATAGAALVIYGTVVRSFSLAGGHRGATATRPDSVPGAMTGTPPDARGSDGGRSRSNHRRSPGPPGAGALGLVMNASCESVSERR